MSGAKDTNKVAKSYQRLYSEASSSSAINIAPTSDRRAELKSFIERTVPPADQKELEAELKKTVPITGKGLRGKRKKVFHKGGNPTKLQPVKRRQGKLLTARERRDLGLHRLPRKGLEYSDLLLINKLWVEYISGLVDLSSWHSGDESFQVRLCRADYHGAEVKVTRSANADLVGIEGLVATETRNTFQVLGKDGVLRTVPKRASSFTFRVGDDHVFTVGGSSMMMKPSERAVKKWKNKTPMDL